MWLLSQRDKKPPALDDPRPLIPTVRFDASQVTPAVEAEIAVTLRGIPGIPRLAIRQVYAAALLAVTRGGDLHVLAQALAGVGMPSKLSGEVAMFINRRAMAMINRNQMLSAGITHARWLYANAPCVCPTTLMRPECDTLDADHRPLARQVFAVAHGMLIRGRRVWPGQDPGCKCVHRALLPGRQTEIALQQEDSP